MSKRGLPSENHFILRIAGGQIKGYHEFKIKGPVGTSFYVFPAHGNRDPFALNCVLPEVSEIPESLLDVPLISKSSRKSYTLREVAGRQIGHVQYFLNRELKLLLDCGKIFRIEGNITGEPTVTRRTLMHQKWKRNVQHGGGAIIPCTWKMHCSENCMEEVKERIQLAIAEMGGESSEMAIEIYGQQPSLTSSPRDKRKKAK